MELDEEMYFLLLFVIPVQVFANEVVDNPPYDPNCIAQAVTTFFPELRGLGIFIGDPDLIPDELISELMSNSSVYIFNQFTKSSDVKFSTQQDPLKYR